MRGVMIILQGSFVRLEQKRKPRKREGDVDAYPVQGFALEVYKLIDTWPHWVRVIAFDYLAHSYKINDDEIKRVMEHRSARTR